MGLHVGKVCKELVNFSEADVAIEGLDVIGGEQDRSGIESGEGVEILCTFLTLNHPVEHSLFVYIHLLRLHNSHIMHTCSFSCTSVFTYTRLR